MALTLIRMKQPMETSDYSLLVACLKELGRIGQLDLAAVLDADRINLAEALMQAGEDEAALRALRENRLETLSRSELTLALRICQRRKDIQTAGKLFQNIKLTLGLVDAPELYLLYALVCEAVGQRRDARDVYEEILRRFPDHQEAAEHLRNL
jgi:tetratricopeptide (TPR) repeat protein